MKSELILSVPLRHCEAALLVAPTRLAPTLSSFALPRRRRQQARCGFTLLELLIVIAIVLVLVGILVPVVGKARKQAQAINTTQAIKAIEVMIQAYYHDFRAYPGPIPNHQLRSASNKVFLMLADDDPREPYILYSPIGITMAENLVLGLFGGLKPGENPGTLTFVYTRVGEGPRLLGPIPKKLPPYGTGVELTQTGKSGLLRAGPSALFDSQVPEIVDRFPEPLPFLYLRARTGKSGVVGTDPDTPAPGLQYDATQVLPYTRADLSDNFLGEGKANDSVRRVLPAEAKNNPLSHGFIAAPVATATLSPDSPGYTYPYNLFAVLRDPATAASACHVGKTATSSSAPVSTASTAPATTSPASAGISPFSLFESPSDGFPVTSPAWRRKRSATSLNFSSARASSPA